MNRRKLLLLIVLISLGASCLCAQAFFVQYKTNPAFYTNIMVVEYGGSSVIAEKRVYVPDEETQLFDIAIATTSSVRINLHIDVTPLSRQEANNVVRSFGYTMYVRPGSASIGFSDKTIDVVGSNASSFTDISFDPVYTNGTAFAAAHVTGNVPTISNVTQGTFVSTVTISLVAN